MGAELFDPMFEYFVVATEKLAAASKLKDAPPKKVHSCFIFRWCTNNTRRVVFVIIVEGGKECVKHGRVEKIDINQES